MSDKDHTKQTENDKPAVTIPGTVEKIIPPVFPGEPEKAEITLNDADPLYGQVRVENTLTNANGEAVGLKKGAQVDVTIEAEPKDTVKKPG